MDKIKTKYYIIRKKIPKSLRKRDLFYYELRHYDNNVSKYVIESTVIVNFYGTLITDREILKGREFIEKSQFLQENDVIRDISLKK